MKLHRGVFQTSSTLAARIIILQILVSGWTRTTVQARPFASFVKSVTSNLMTFGVNGISSFKMWSPLSDRVYFNDNSHIIPSVLAEQACRREHSSVKYLSTWNYRWIFIW